MSLDSNPKHLVPLQGLRINMPNFELLAGTSATLLYMYVHSSVYGGGICIEY